MGPAISDNTCIKEMDLSWNCFRRKGAVAIALGVKVSLLVNFEKNEVINRNTHRSEHN